MGDYMGTVFLSTGCCEQSWDIDAARLLIRPSELRQLNPHTKEYDMPIGNGLFCKERIQNGQQIVRFSGEPLRNRTEVQHARAVFQHGGYVIY